MFIKFSWCNRKFVGLAKCLQILHNMKMRKLKELNILISKIQRNYKGISKKESFSLQFMLSFIPEAFSKQICAFFSIWSFFQWSSSLIGLVLLYWAGGHFYNKYLAKHSCVLETNVLVCLIFVDLTVNLILGIYYMGYRETVMGQIMLTCPIAISPIIFILELSCYFFYGRYVRLKE